MAITPEVARSRARIAALERHHPHNAEALADARRDLELAKTERAIRQLVAAAPPLRPEHVERLRNLLPPVGTAEGTPPA